MNRIQNILVPVDFSDHSGRALDMAVSLAKSLGADLIVMGTRGLAGIKHVLLGSVAERVLRRAPCPVVTVKASDIV